MENQDNADEISPIQLRYRAVHRRMIESPAVESKPVARVPNAKGKHRKKSTPAPAVKEKFSKPDTHTKKRWTAEETQRLKNVLKVAVNPQTEEDWMKVARATGERTGVECQEQAKKIEWIPPVHPQILQLGIEASDIDDLEGISARNSINNSNSVSNKQSNTMKSSFEEDFFGAQNRQQDISILDLDPDDSLLQTLTTPKPNPKPKKIRRPFMMKVITESPNKNENSGEET